MASKLCPSCSDPLFGIESQKARANQLSINSDWLMEKLDAIHLILCPGKNGTWQTRAEQALEAVREIKKRRNGKQDCKAWPGCSCIIRGSNEECAKHMEKNHAKKKNSRV